MESNPENLNTLEERLNIVDIEELARDLLIARSTGDRTDMGSLGDEGFNRWVVDDCFNRAKEFYNQAEEK